MLILSMNFATKTNTQTRNNWLKLC